MSDLIQTIYDSDQENASQEESEIELDNEVASEFFQLDEEAVIPSKRSKRNQSWAGDGQTSVNDKISKRRKETPKDEDDEDDASSSEEEIGAAAEAKTAVDAARLNRIRLKSLKQREMKKNKEMQEKEARKAEKKQRVMTNEERLAAKRERELEEACNREMTSFYDLKLCKSLLRAIEDLGFIYPTAVQTQSIPAALLGRDLLVTAVTGSGKTAAFMLPILERLVFRPGAACTRVVVLNPTRELATQCHEMTNALAKYTDIRTCLIVGGFSNLAQGSELKTKPDIVIGTPGRVIDHIYNTPTFTLDSVEVLVLDEADRLLETGFADEVKEIVKACPKHRQTMLFSATLSEEVETLVEMSLKEPKQVSIDPHYSITQNLKQEFIRLKNGHDEHRASIVLSLCKRVFKHKTIIFCKSKKECHRLRIIFGFSNLRSAELHGNLTQPQRMEALELFKENDVDFLLCTDLASRGIDIPGVNTVINMDMPMDIRSYIHRVGRTARAGRNGIAVSIIGENDRRLLKEIVRKAPDVVNSRTVPPAIIKKYVQKIASLQDDIKAVLEEEAEERAFRLADMEANKINNLIQYKDEIAARPAKTWFQSEKDRKMAKASSESMFTDFENKRMTNKQRTEEKKKEAEKTAQKTREEMLRGLPRKKRRRKLMIMEMEREEKRERRFNAKEAKHKPEVTPEYVQSKMEGAQRANAHIVKGNLKPYKQPQETLKQKRKRKLVIEPRYAREQTFTERFSEQTTIRDGIEERDRAIQKKKRPSWKKSVGSFKSKSKYKRR